MELRGSHRPTRVRLAALALLAAGVLSSGAALAQPRDYPVRPIRMLVGFAAGANTDTVARLIGKGLSERLGQPVIVENRPGAGGMIAADAVAKAAPDGYTISTVSAGLSAYPALYRALPFDIDRDIAPIAFVGSLPTVLSVHKDVPVRTLAELIDHAKRNPGLVKFGTAGIGSSTHMLTELMASQAGIRMLHVPYKSAPLATTALMGGEIDLQIETLIGVVAHLGDPNTRRLAITGTSRSRLAPDIPTFAEGGLPAFDSEVWFAVVGPGGLPRAIVERLNATINEVLASEEVQTRLATRGGIVLSPGSADRFAALLRADVQRWRRVVQEAGIATQ